VSWPRASSYCGLWRSIPHCGALSTESGPALGTLSSLVTAAGSAAQTTSRSIARSEMSALRRFARYPNAIPSKRNPYLRPHRSSSGCTHLQGVIQRVSVVKSSIFRAGTVVSKA
jgi:hypothetical protein